MRIIFFGSSKYSVIVAQKLHQAFPLSAVVTKNLSLNPVKEFALQNNIPFIEGDVFSSKQSNVNCHAELDSASRSRNKFGMTNIGSRQTRTIISIEQLHAYKPDFLVVADFGLILPKKLLIMPKYAPLNVHHSLLPKYRGPSPAPSAILAGEKISGVSIIEMTDKVDAGDILAQKEYALKPDETTDSLLTELNKLGAEILIPVIKDFETYYKKRAAQNETEATFTQYMKKEDGYIDLQSSDISLPASARPWQAGHLSLDIARKIRAYYPWPGVWTNIMINDKGLRIKLLPSPVIPSEVEKSFPFLIQVEGKKPISYKDFLNGYPQLKQTFSLLFS